MMRRRSTRLLMLGAAAAVAITACGDDEDESQTTPIPPTTNAQAATTSPSGGPTVKVTGIDYAFTGVPKEIEAGTKLEFTNSSTKELHEMVVMPIPDDEKRPVAALVALPQDEQRKVFGENAEPATVIVAGPGGNPVIPAVGDGTISEPGRYAILCFIPVGADPKKALDAMQASTGGPPDLGDGPPHVARGMFAEVTVK